MNQLFNHIPLQLVLDWTENSIRNTTIMHSVSTDDIMPLRKNLLMTINFCLLLEDAVNQFACVALDCADDHLLTHDVFSIINLLDRSLFFSSFAETKQTLLTIAL